MRTKPGANLPCVQRSLSMCPFVCSHVFLMCVLEILHEPMRSKLYCVCPAYVCILTCVFASVWLGAFAFLFTSIIICVGVCANVHYMCI